MRARLQGLLVLAPWAVGAASLLAAFGLPAQINDRDQLDRRGAMWGRATANDPDHPQQLAPLFDLWPANPGENGCAQLPAELCINNSCVTPLLRYHGRNATTTAWPAWDYGEALVKAEVGTDVTPNVDTPFLHTLETAVELNAADYFQASNAAFGEITTQDIVVEMVVGATDVTGNDGYIAKKINTGDNTGWQVIQGGGGDLITMQLDDGADAVSVNSSSLAAQSWNHVIGYFDRSGSGVWYTNAVAGSAVSIAAAASTLANAATFAVGNSQGGIRLDSRIACLTVWLHSDIGTHLQPANATERLQRVAGVWPNVARGSKVATTITRGSPAYLRKRTSGITTLHRVGTGWPRVERTALGVGYLQEAASTSVTVQSNDIATSWTELDAGDTQSLNSATLPTGQATADGSIADATDGVHGYSQASPALSSGPVYDWSVFAKAGNQGWAYIDNTTVANATAYFDLDPCAEGTKGAGAIDHYVEDYGGGWCRIGFTFGGTAAAHTVRFLSATADGDNTFAGDGATVNTSWGGMQLALVTDAGRFVSLIDTTTGSVTRSADALVFADTGNTEPSGGTVVVTVMIGEHSYANAAGPRFATVGGSAQGVILSLSGNTSDNLRCDVNSGSVSQGLPLGPATVLGTGARHTLACTWQTNDIRVWQDGVAGPTPDTSATAPGAFGSLTAGGAPGAFTQIERLRVFPRGACNNATCLPEVYK